MRFHKRQIPAPCSTRVVRRFLWVPVRLNVEGTGQSEKRWAEVAQIRQKAGTDWDYPWSTYWEDQAFVTGGSDGFCYVPKESSRDD